MNARKLVEFLQRIIDEHGDEVEVVVTDGDSEWDFHAVGFPARFGDRVGYLVQLDFGLPSENEPAEPARPST